MQQSGRDIFGVDVEGYAAGRPNYSDAVYAHLEKLGALHRDANIFEIGPGTGQASSHILGMGVRSLVAVEPDPRLADHLRARALDDHRLDVVNAAFEDAPLEPARFDLGIAATAFHWVDTEPALAKILTLLRPGGHWAMWWNIVHDAAHDPFSRAVLPLLGDISLPPSLSGPDHEHYSLNTRMRLAELRNAGFVSAEHVMFTRTVPMTAADLRALYATFSMVRRLDEARRADVLDGIEALANERFGGRIERSFRTPLYTARRPG